MTNVYLEKAAQIAQLEQGIWKTDTGYAVNQQGRNTASSDFVKKFSNSSGRVGATVGAIGGAATGALGLLGSRGKGLAYAAKRIGSGVAAGGIAGGIAGKLMGRSAANRQVSTPEGQRSATTRYLQNKYVPKFNPGKTT